MNIPSEQARCEQFEADVEREYPTCRVDGCGGRIGIDCSGHCLGCGEEPKRGEDFCPACIAKINRVDPTVFE